MQRLSFSGAWLLVLSILVASESAAQQSEPFPVSLRVVSADGAPLGDALVRLMNLDDTVVTQRFSDGAGLVRLEVPRPGRYRFSVDRLGYARWESEPVALTGPRSTPLELQVPLQPIQLDALDVPGEERCSRTRPLLVRALGRVFSRGPRFGSAGDPAALPLMHERTMAAMQQVIDGRPVNARYTYRVDDSTLEFQHRRVAQSVDTVTMDTPLASPDPDRVALRGYLEAPAVPGEPSTYHMLTPEVIASENFTLQHCFQVVELPDSGWLGLAFEPLPGSSRYDVRGVIWLDTIAWRAQRLEFNYTRLGEFLVENGEWRAAIRQVERDWSTIRQGERAYHRLVGRRNGERRISTIRPTPKEEDFGGVVRFGDIGQGHWDVTWWQLRWPGLVGRGTLTSVAEGITRNGRMGVITEVSHVTRVLHLSRTGELISANW